MSDHADLVRSIESNWWRDNGPFLAGISRYQYVADAVAAAERARIAGQVEAEMETLIAESWGDGFSQARIDAFRSVLALLKEGTEG